MQRRPTNSRREERTITFEYVSISTTSPQSFISVPLVMDGAPEHPAYIPSG